MFSELATLLVSDLVIKLILLVSELVNCQLAAIDLTNWWVWALICDLFCYFVRE